MKRKEPEDESSEFERAIASRPDSKLVLRLFVNGTTPISMRAINNMRKICDEHLAGRFELEVIDIQKQPHLATPHQIVATPTLIKSLPLPMRRLLGDLSDKQKVLVGLDVIPRHAQGARGAQQK